MDDIGWSITRSCYDVSYMLLFPCVYFLRHYHSYRTSGSAEYSLQPFLSVAQFLSRWKNILKPCPTSTVSHKRKGRWFSKYCSMVIYSYQFLTSILNFRRKPIFLIIHKSQCAACQYLQNIFNRSKELPTYAQDFVMVNAEVCIMAAI